MSNFQIAITSLKYPHIVRSTVKSDAMLQEVHGVPVAHDIIDTLEAEVEVEEKIEDIAEVIYWMTGDTTSVGYTVLTKEDCRTIARHLYQNIIPKEISVMAK